MSTIKSSTTSTTAYSVVADTTGTLVFQTGATPTTAMTLGSDQSVTFAGTPTYTAGTANGVAYLNGSKVLTTGSALVFDGTNLGVGVTPSAWGGTSKAIQLAAGSLESRGQTISMPQNAYFNGTNWIYSSTTLASLYAQNAGIHYWYNAASGTAGNVIPFTQAMTLSSGGKLSVGTTGTSGILNLKEGDVSFEVNSDSTTSSILSYNRGSGAYASLGLRSSDVRFLIADVEKARIDSSGNLLVGTTSTVATSRSTIKGNDNILTLDNTGAQYTTLLFSNNAIARAYVYYDNTNTRTYVQTGVTGGVYLASGGTSWTAASDERVKDIIEPIENATQKLSAWRTVVGKYKADAEGTRRSFLIAQDVLATFPEAVDTTNSDEYGLNYQDTIPVLVKAIQEQQALITQLQADVAALKGNA